MIPVVCPKCQRENRLGAHFCSYCRAPLAAAAPRLPSFAPIPYRPVSAASRRHRTQKVCPVCTTSNPIEAGFCLNCNYGFSTLKPFKTGKTILIWLTVATMALVVMGIGLATFLAQPDQLSATTSPLTVSSPTAPQVVTTIAARTATREPIATVMIMQDPLDRSRQATVQVLVEDNREPGKFSAGSGSVITSQGHILTNFHVLGDKDTGQLYNRDGAVLIAISSSDMRSEPEITYSAKIEQINIADDLALLKITAFSNNMLLPASFSMPYMPLGDSDTVQIGDEIVILGYPDLGGRSITQTRGIVSGFVTSDNFFKTDAEINPGNSGGAAVNQDGQLIGIPTAGSIGEEFPGKLGLVRPINQAGPLIHRALDETGETP